MNFPAWEDFSPLPVVELLQVTLSAPAASVAPAPTPSLLASLGLALPGPRQWLFSATSFAAAALALFIAFSLDLPRPYWAATTVYVASQPSAGGVRSRSLWRLVGTLAGGAFSVVAVPHLANAPVLLSLAYALWVGFCLAASLRDGTPRGYAYMLAGYTAAIIGFPAVNDPGSMFDTALARVEEIGLGIGCAWLMHGVILPSPGTPLLLRRLQSWLEELAAFTATGLSPGRGAATLVAERRRLAQDGAALDQQFLLARYEPGQANALRWLPPLRATARRVPAIVTAAADRMALLRAADPQAADDVQPLLDDVAAWMCGTAAATGTSAPEALLARLRAAEAEAAASGTWPGLIREGVLARLLELLVVWQDCLRLSAGLRGLGTAEPPPMPPRSAGQSDPLLIGLSGLAAGLAVLACCAFWYFTAWPDGATAAMMAAVGSSIFAHLDDPAPAIASFLTSLIAAVIVAGFYLFAVLPAIDGFVLLVAALGALYLPLGAALAMPALTPRTLPVAMNAFALMSLQETYSATLPGFLDSAAAMIIGFAVALVTTRLVRSFGVDLRVRRLVVADRRDMARLAEGRATELHPITAAMLDRFEALAARLGAADAATLGVRELAELRAALNLVRLREAMPGLAPAARAAAAAALADIAALARGQVPAEAVLPRLDAALRAASRDAEHRAAALALSGIRLALFPEAPPPVLDLAAA